MSKFGNIFNGFGAGQRVPPKIIDSGYGLYYPFDAEDINFGANTADDGNGTADGTFNHFDRADLTSLGGACIFDGAIGCNEAIQTNLNFGAKSNYSIVCFVSTEDFGAGSTKQDIFGCYDSGISTNGFIARKEADADNFQLFYYNSGVSKSLGTVGDFSDGVIGFALTVDGNTGKSYNSDGLIATNTNIPSLVTMADLQLGAQGQGSFDFKGDIYSFYCFDKTLTADEVATCLKAGKDSYSPIVEGVIAQYSGRDFAGTSSAPTTIYDSNMIVSDGQGRQAIKFDGVDDYISDNTISTNYRSITFTLYTDGGFSKRIFSGGSYYPQDINISSDGRIQGEFTNTANDTTRRFVSNVIMAKGWHTVTMQQGSVASDVEVFVDGKSVLGSKQVIGYTHHNTGINIGRWQPTGTTDMFDGAISQVIINKDRKITLTEHRTIYLRNNRLLGA